VPLYRHLAVLTVQESSREKKKVRREEERDKISETRRRYDVVRRDNKGSVALVHRTDGNHNFYLGIISAL